LILVGAAMGLRGMEVISKNYNPQTETGTITETITETTTETIGEDFLIEEKANRKTARNLFGVSAIFLGTGFAS
jgi:hypothetical protein